MPAQSDDLTCHHILLTTRGFFPLLSAISRNSRDLFTYTQLYSIIFIAYTECQNSILLSTERRSALQPLARVTVRSRLPYIHTPTIVAMYKVDRCPHFRHFRPRRYSRLTTLPLVRCESHCQNDRGLRLLTIPLLSGSSSQSQGYFALDLSSCMQGWPSR